MVLQKEIFRSTDLFNIELFLHDNKDAKVMQPDNELHNISMGYLSFTMYYSKINGITDLLENLDSNTFVSDKHLVIY